MYCIGQWKLPVIILTSSFDEIWHGDTYKKLRKAMYNDKKVPIVVLAILKKKAVALVQDMMQLTSSMMVAKIWFYIIPRDTVVVKVCPQYIWILGLAIFVTWLVECVDTLAVVNGLLMLKN